MTRRDAAAWLLTATAATIAAGSAEPAAAQHSGPATEILGAMDAYTGQWRSEERKGGQGESFHFEIELRWMDPGRTIARLHITRVEAGGAISTVFEGYKGREPTGDGVYYWAASPAGRASRGHVELDGRDFVTDYDGWTADGSVVRIRDVFSPVKDGIFISRTFLRNGPGEEWRQIAEDHWRRVAGD